MPEPFAAHWYTHTELNAGCASSLATLKPITDVVCSELWALLHFIMPSLFDSHDEFNEWFSKDIENAAENKGSKLNEHQLRRLHMILKPFMLRRVKRHVQNELSDKVNKPNCNSRLLSSCGLYARSRRTSTWISVLGNVHYIEPCWLTSPWQICSRRQPILVMQIPRGRS